MTTTPVKIKHMPIIAGKSGIYLYITALIDAIKKIPIPAHIA